MVAFMQGLKNEELVKIFTRGPPQSVWPRMEVVDTYAQAKFAFHNQVLGGKKYNNFNKDSQGRNDESTKSNNKQKNLEFIGIVDQGQGG